ARRSERVRVQACSLLQRDRACCRRVSAQAYRNDVEFPAGVLLFGMPVVPFRWEPRSGLYDGTMTYSSSLGSMSSGRFHSLYAFASPRIATPSTNEIPPTANRHPGNAQPRRCASVTRYGKAPSAAVGIAFTKQRP